MLILTHKLNLSCYARLVSSVHARLDAIEQDRDRQGSRQYHDSHAHQSVNPGPLSDQLIHFDGDASSRVLPSSRPGRRVVPEHLVGELYDQQTSQLISNLCNEACYGKRESLVCPR